MFRASNPARLSRVCRAQVVLAVVAASATRAPAELRELNPDRPNVTEGPFTVDAGHWQVEMDLVSHTRDSLDGVRTREWDVAPMNLRLGLTPAIEAGIFLEPFAQVTSEPRGGNRSTQTGVGDTTLRAKFNFTGNDGGGPAFGLIADVKVPTASAGLGNGAVEGDLVLPFACELPAGWELGAMTKLDVRHRDGGGRRGVWINSVTLGHDLARRLSGYVELTSAAGDGPHVATLDVGVAWKMDANTQFDAGANLGLSRTADDLQVFTGVSRRY